MFWMPTVSHLCVDAITDPVQFLLKTSRSVKCYRVMVYNNFKMHVICGLFFKFLARFTTCYRLKYFSTLP